MELRALRYFVEVVRQKSYTAAAQKLFVTQPTLSRQVAELEDELGEKLLTRSTRSVEVTEKGARFYRRAVSILALTEQARREITDETALAGDIRITAGEIPCLSLVIAAVSDLQKKYPRIRCHYQSTTADVAAQNLRLGLADIAVYSAGADLKGFESLALPAESRWGVMTQKDGPLRDASGITPEKLKKLALYLPGRFSDEERGAFAGWAGCRLDELSCCGTYNLWYNASLAVHHGAQVLGIDGIVPEDSALRFVPLTPELPYKASMVWLPSSRESPLVRAVIEAVKKEIGAA